METQLRKVQKVTILTYLKVLFAGRCSEQLDNSWHTPSAASPSSPDANPFPDDTHGGWCSPPWRMVIITIATLWETRNPPNSALLWNWVPGLQLNKVLKVAFPVPQLPGGHRRSPCDRTAGPAHPVGTNSRSSASNSGTQSIGENSGVPVGRSPRLGRSRCRQGPGSLWGLWSREKTSFSGRLPRGALLPLHSEPLISGPALVSTPRFLGGDFRQSGLHWCCLCCGWWLEIRTCCGVFSDSGLFLGERSNSGERGKASTIWTGIC